MVCDRRKCVFQPPQKALGTLNEILTSYKVAYVENHLFLCADSLADFRTVLLSGFLFPPSSPQRKIMDDNDHPRPARPHTSLLREQLRKLGKVNTTSRHYHAINRRREARRKNINGSALRHEYAYKLSFLRCHSDKKKNESPPKFIDCRVANARNGRDDVDEYRC